MWTWRRGRKVKPTGWTREGGGKDYQMCLEKEDVELVVKGEQPQDAWNLLCFEWAGHIQSQIL